MRVFFKAQTDLRYLSISEITFDPRSRHELGVVLRGLQHIFTNKELNGRVGAVLQAELGDDHSQMGRPGMSYWEILVLGVVRHALKADYDQLHDLANHHRKLREVLGVEPRATFMSVVEQKRYPLQTLKDNVRLLDETVLSALNRVIVGAGHDWVKKKPGRRGKEASPLALRVKADTFPTQGQVHFPTDINLLWDAARKCFDTMEHLHQGRSWPQWRKRKANCKKIKRLFLRLNNIKGRNKAQRQREAARPYLNATRKLADRVLMTIKLSRGMSLSTKEIAHLEALAYYHEHLCRQIDLLHRRVIKGEAIPHEEKVFSIHEPHVQWINKGKRHIDIGHPVLIASDQYHFILDYEVLYQGQADVETALPLAQRLCERYGVAKLRSLSLDRGFYSQQNKEELLKYVEALILPKKGKKSQQEALDEAQDDFVALKNAHSAVESNINQLHANGLDHCPDRSLTGFRRYVGYGVLAYNLHRLGSLIIREERAQAAAEAHRRKASAAA